MMASSAPRNFSRRRSEAHCFGLVADSSAPDIAPIVGNRDPQCGQSLLHARCPLPQKLRQWRQLASDAKQMTA